MSMLRCGVLGEAEGAVVRVDSVRLAVEGEGQQKQGGTDEDSVLRRGKGHRRRHRRGRRVGRGSLGPCMGNPREYKRESKLEGGGEYFVNHCEMKGL